MARNKKGPIYGTFWVFFGLFQTFCDQKKSVDFKTFFEFEQILFVE